MTIRLRLYVSSARAASLAAAERARELCATMADACELEVIDVEDRPDLAEAERVIATPTLDKLHPIAPRRAVGELDDFVAVARHLGLRMRDQDPMVSAD